MYKIFQFNICIMHMLAIKIKKYKKKIKITTKNIKRELLSVKAGFPHNSSIAMD